MDHILPIWRGGDNSEGNLRVVCPNCNRRLSDDVLAIAANPSTALARIWIAFFEQMPKSTGVATIALVASVVGAFVSLDRADLSKPNPTFEQQLQQLDATQESLNSLSNFVQLQKQQLTESRESLVRLRQEKANLEPVVAADRQTVRAILANQEARLAERASEERWIGFGLGVLSSLVASAIAGIWSYFRLRKRKPN